LVLEDGIGAREKKQFPRVAHGIRRVVVIGNEGTVSLSALRWLADQDSAFIMLDRDGSVLVTTGPVRPSDARLRRAQVLAHQNGTALEITRYLIDEKTAAQARVARDCLHDEAAARAIAQIRCAIANAQTSEVIRFLESRAALVYWSAWKSVAISFPTRELRRTPDHWRTFGARVSPLTGSPRLATNPPNAILNYLYAVLESEARLATAALGLDPGLGMLHVDSQTRDSLACDVMEPIRPEVDAYVLRWISRETLKREWFFEERDGNCRLMGSFAVQLSETAATWAGLVAPVAERVTQILWSTVPKSPRKHALATRLTQLHRREVSGGQPASPPALPRPESFCKTCGASVGRGQMRCRPCADALNTADLIKAAEQGRIAAHSEQAEKRRAETQRRQWARRGSWKPSDLPDWLDKDMYCCEIKPRLKQLTLSALSSTLGITLGYAADVRGGRRVPHPRHWKVLAELVGVSSHS